MHTRTNNLPESPVELKSICLRQSGEIEWLKQDVERLEAMLRLLRHQRFGSKSEQSEHPTMRALFPESDDSAGAESGEAKDAVTAVKAHDRKNTPRKPFPDSIPRQVVPLELPESERICACCGGTDTLKKVSEDISEKLNMTPATFTVFRYVRPIYSCKSCETMKAVAMPPHPIPKCSVTTETLSQIAVNKYLDCLPLYRQEQIFLREGVDIGRDKMARWMIDIGEWLIPVRNRLHEMLLSQDILHMDETTLQVLKEQNRLPTSKSYMVVQARGDPGGRAIVLFHYSPSRSRDAMESLLKDFSGILLTDGLSVYNSYCDGRPSVVHAGCWSHARRKFTDAQKGALPSSRKGSLAKVAVDLIDKLFAIEAEYSKSRDTEFLLKIRIEKSLPLIEELETWLTTNLQSVPKKSLTGQAMRYLSNQWPKLLHFLDDGKIPLHNNFVENAIRPFALGRKNWLFSDGEAGAEASAILYSLLVTAKINGLNPGQYLTRALCGIAAGEDPNLHLPFRTETIH